MLLEEKRSSHTDYSITLLTCRWQYSCRASKIIQSHKLTWLNAANTKFYNFTLTRLTTDKTLKFKSRISFSNISRSIGRGPLWTVLSVKECKTLRSLAIAHVGKTFGVWGILVCFNLYRYVKTGYKNKYKNDREIQVYCEAGSLFVIFYPFIFDQFYLKVKGPGGCHNAPPTVRVNMS